MMPLSILVLLFYIFWLLISMLAQGESDLNRKIRKRDIFHLIPNYKFFCPRPTKNDYHLFYRTQKADASMNDWAELTPGKRDRRYCFLWHPEKRDRKIFYKIVKLIRVDYAAGKREQYGHLYQSLLNYIKTRGENNVPSAVQFRITSRQDLVADAKEIILYTSIIHKTQ
jgi:hypothetical protein